MMRTSVVLALPMAAALLAPAPAQAQSIVDMKKLENSIERGLKQRTGYRITAKCPKQVTWVKGKTFTCRVSASNGAKGKVQVTLKSNAKKGRLKWVVIS